MLGCRVAGRYELLVVMTLTVGLMGSVSVLWLGSHDGSLGPKLRPSELVAAAKA
jgi:hypothetical protein